MTIDQPSSLEDEAIPYDPTIDLLLAVEALRKIASNVANDPVSPDNTVRAANAILMSLNAQETRLKLP